MTTENKANKGQLACLGAMITKLKLQSSKESIVLGFTNGRTDSRADMYKEEATAMIKYLKSLDPDEQKAEKQRRYIISMAHECGYRKPGTTKVDMKRLDEWCVKYGMYHKKLNQHNVDEIPHLVTQFKERYKSYLKNF